MFYIQNITESSVILLNHLLASLDHYTLVALANLLTCEVEDRSIVCFRCCDVVDAGFNSLQRDENIVVIELVSFTEFLHGSVNNHFVAYLDLVGRSKLLAIDVETAVNHELVGSLAIIRDSICKAAVCLVQACWSYPSRKPE